jgi:hypothetical protein
MVRMRLMRPSFLGNECVDLSLGRVALQKPGAHEPKLPNVSKFRATRPRTEDADVHVNFGSKPTLMERAGLAQSGHAPKQRRLPSAMSGSAQRPSAHLSPFRSCQLRRPKEKPPEGCEACNSQSTPADCRAWQASSIKKSGLSRSFLVLYARTPLPIVTHILSGRPVVVRPTLGAMGSSSLARYERAGACLSTAEPADVHQIATTDAVKFHGEGRGGNC